LIEINCWGSIAVKGRRVRNKKEEEEEEGVIDF
jgi:hypothetical protein